MKRALLLLLLVLFTVNCAGRRAEVWRVYRGQELPLWVQEEWRNAQDELLRLPNIPEDPRRYGPEEWEWVQMEDEFWVSDTVSMMRVKGFTKFDSHDILICCGDRETVRHEAFHAILWKMGDERYLQHYPDLKKELK